eukprot:gene15798-18730_t
MEETMGKLIVEVMEPEPEAAISLEAIVAVAEMERGRDIREQAEKDGVQGGVQEVEAQEPSGGRGSSLDNRTNQITEQLRIEGNVNPLEESEGLSVGRTVSKQSCDKLNPNMRSLKVTLNSAYSPSRSTNAMSEVIDVWGTTCAKEYEKQESSARACDSNMPFLDLDSESSRTNLNLLDVVLKGRYAARYQLSLEETYKTRNAKRGINVQELKRREGISIRSLDRCKKRA